MQKDQELINPFIVPDPVVKKLEITDSSYPFNMAIHQEDPVNVAEYGYVEEEYLVSGLANVYAWKGTTGRPRIKTKDAPYCTRVIVRKPKDPASFSGSVMVELMHGGMKVDNPNIGYDQADRLTLYKVASEVGFDPARVKTKCETDCSALVRVCEAYAGVKLSRLRWWAC